MTILSVSPGSPMPFIDNTPWYLRGNVPIGNIVAAYQPKGAASFLASKVNIVSPGTHDAGNGANFPTWIAGTGWTFNGVNQYLITDIVPVNDQTWSAIVKFKNYNFSAFGGFLGQTDGGGFGFILVNQWAPPNIIRNYFNGGTWTVTSSGSIDTKGVIAMAGRRTYFNGVEEGALIPPGGGAFILPLWVGCYNSGVVSGPCATDIHALAIYNITLSLPQISAVTMGMQAL